MKQFFLMLIITVVMLSCATQRKTENTNGKSVEVSAQDSMEYDVETFDQKFEAWYAVQNSPAKYRSQDYYERWNQEYVAAWNAKCASRDQNWHFEPVVGYLPGEDYGFEMNHKLFYYFMYVENVLKIRIIPGGPKVFEPQPGS
jgi:hypothetical protein